MTQMAVLHEQRWTHDGRPALNRRADQVPPVPGPWDDEPDKVQWVDAATDLDCLAVRNHFGAWCGYVGVPPGHPFHGKHYDECLIDCGEEYGCWVHRPNDAVEVHGGLTFASGCDEDAAEGHGICHVPLPGREPEVWWLGFDCGHGFDVTPYRAAEVDQRPEDAWWMTPRGAEYRTLGYVQEQCASLAAQLKAVQ